RVNRERFCTKFSEGRSAGLGIGKGVLGLRESQRPAKVSRAVAREFCWLALCQSRARTKGSRHRLDYFEHLKRDRTPLALDRAARNSDNRRYRDRLLSHYRDVGGQHRR